MPKKQETIRTMIQPHGSKNRDKIGSHDSLLPFKFEPKIKNTEKQKKEKHNC